MDWQSLWLSVKLAAISVLVLLPLAILLSRLLAYREFHGKSWVEALITGALVLPPTVIGITSW